MARGRERSCMLASLARMRMIIAEYVESASYFYTGSMGHRAMRLQGVRVGALGHQAMLTFWALGWENVNRVLFWHAGSTHDVCAIAGVQPRRGHGNPDA